MIDNGLLERGAGGQLELTRRGFHEFLTLLPDSEGIGCGLIAFVAVGSGAPWNILIRDNAILHWNINFAVLGDGQYKLADGGRVSRHLLSGSGAYRLIGLDEAGKPASLNRIGGRDKTGTLYIGRFLDQLRIQQLVRSLRPGARRRSYSSEHEAPLRLRSHAGLAKRFAISRLAIDWHYTREYVLAVRLLLYAYEASFGEFPPLNRR